MLMSIKHLCHPLVDLVLFFPSSFPQHADKFVFFYRRVQLLNDVTLSP